jgi:hypothetical protein
MHAVAYDNSRTMTPRELMKLTELAMADLARSIDDASELEWPRHRPKPEAATIVPFTSAPPPTVSA